VIVVLDTNTLASMAVAPFGGTLAVLLELWRTNVYDVSISQPIYGELERTFANPYFTNRLAAQDIAEYLQFVRSSATFTQITAAVQGVATHPEDDLILATAVSAQAPYLVTGDRRFRRHVPSYQGVTLLRPLEFLQVLQRQMP
jgi:putative PIN family toxin of toxin-antitoxin system